MQNILQTRIAACDRGQLRQRRRPRPRRPLREAKLRSVRRARGRDSSLGALWRSSLTHRLGGCLHKQRMLMRSSGSDFVFVCKRRLTSVWRARAPPRFVTSSRTSTTMSSTTRAQITCVSSHETARHLAREFSTPLCGRCGALLESSVFCVVCWRTSSLAARARAGARLSADVVGYLRTSGHLRDVAHF